MAILNVLTYPDKFLASPTAEVKNIDGGLQQIIHDMAETMYAAPGIGLAASQVGINQRILVYDISPRDENRHIGVLINPRIVEAEGQMVSEDEGCLSVPDFRSDVRRAARVQVEGFDREGKPVHLDAEGLLAIVLQHEIDHLNGTLFIDRISALKRELYKRRVHKKLREK